MALKIQLATTKKKKRNKKNKNIQRIIFFKHFPLKLGFKHEISIKKKLHTKTYITKNTYIQ